MTSAQAPLHIVADSSSDARLNTAFAFARRGMGALSHGWRFAEACCRTSGCRDDGAPAYRVDPAMLERANADIAAPGELDP